MVQSSNPHRASKFNRFKMLAEQFIGTKQCFRIILGLFVAESAWIAVSAGYPMPFDEDFHFGIIKIYAQQWSPFFSHQPLGGDAFGALARDPSYLYHYLMSFPYRIVALCTNSQMVQVMALRFIDILLVVISLVLFRRILLKTKASARLVNLTILFFVLVPVVPLLAGQINYDDLLLPLTTVCLLGAMEFKERLAHGEVAIGLGFGVLALCMLTSLVQFEFLPIFAAIVLYTGYSLWTYDKTRSKRLHRAFRQSWKLLKYSRRLAYVAGLLLAIGLFGERYGINLVAYKNPVPQCNQVLSISQCSAYIPWERNYADAISKPAVDINPIPYTSKWLYGMFTNTFFTASGGADTSAFYVHVRPLPVISVTAITILAGGIPLFIKYRRPMLRDYPLLGFLLLVSTMYVVTLWIWNYHDFVHLGEAVALNGRYLFPVLPLGMLAIGLAYQYWLSKRRSWKIGLAMIVFVLFLQGGGALTFIDASNPGWYWPNDSFVQGINGATQKIIQPVIIQ